MSTLFQFQLSEADVLRVLGEYVNRTLFKKPLLLTSITPLSGGCGFEFTAELEQQAREPNGAEQNP